MPRYPYRVCENDTPDGFPKLVSVTLTLPQEDAPLADTIVSLASGSEFSVGGVRDAKGNVVVYTRGKHKVRVTKTESDPGLRAPKSFTGPLTPTCDVGKIGREVT